MGFSLSRRLNYDTRMLSYLHAFHAGNSADVLKHSALVFCLEYLKKKEKPLLCVDTHAGAGFYDLSGTNAPANREWEKGLGLLPQNTAELPAMLANYVKRVTADKTNPARYPGSPAIMAKMLAAGDRLVCFELHPRQAQLLKTALAEIREKAARSSPAIEARCEDGLRGLKSLLPPPSRRGLVLVDPPWEEKSEYETVPCAVQSALKRFPQGTFIIWYPLLAIPKTAAAAPVRETLFDLSGGNRCRLELYTHSPESPPPTAESGTENQNSPRNMYGCGLVIYNPPWTLRPALEETLPYLAGVFGKNGGWNLTI